MNRFFLALLSAAVLAGAANAAAPMPPKAVDPKALKTFLDAHCLRCHDANLKEGGLDLTALSTDFSDSKTFARWVKIHDRVHNGEMPPTKAARPDAKQTKEVLSGLFASLATADRARNGKSGRATLRRLTRGEYEHVMQDLFALPGMPLKDDLPEDGSAHGFNKVSEALDVSHVQMARYLDAAQATLRRAVATRPEKPKPLKMRYYPADTHGFLTGLTSGDCVLLKDKKRDPSLPLLAEQLPSEKIHYYIDTVFRANKSAVGVFRHTDDSFEPGFWKFSPMLPGRYKFRLSVWSFWWDKGQVQPSKRTQVVGIRTQRSVIGFFDAPSLKSKVHEFEVWLEPNDVILFNTASLELVHVYHQKGRSKEYQGPGIAVDWLDVEGPVHDAWPPASHARLFGELPLEKFVAAKDGKGPRAPARPAFVTQRRRDSTYPGNVWEHGRVDGVYTVTSESPRDDAKKLLKPFLTRAFRRPVTDAQLARYAGVVDARLKAGDGFEEAMRAAYAVALCAPEFLYRVEKPGALDDWAVAARLSFFLWNSLPDAELIELAQRGELKRGGDVLRNQVRRMLKDPRSDRFVEDFLGQWLSLNEIAATTPDKQLYPEFKPYLQDCMVGETHAFFRNLLTHNLGIANLIDSAFAMLNAELGKLYGIEEAPEGHGFWRVALPDGSRRGGLLTQASILKVTANGTLTSPVKRGAWVLDRILGKPPEPPPPNVGEVDPDLRGATTIRQQLDLHRKHASCAGCHRSIDPPGFALESYDVIGRYRERYRSKEKGLPVKYRVGEGHYGVSYKLGLPVDSSGEAPDGTKFKGIDDFKKWLLKDERQLALNYLRKLVVYATGREAGFADREAIEAILDRCGNVNRIEKTNFGAYRMRSLIEELVTSELFLWK